VAVEGWRATWGIAGDSKHDHEETQAHRGAAAQYMVVNFLRWAVDGAMLMQAVDWAVAEAASSARRTVHGAPLVAHVLVPVAVGLSMCLPWVNAKTSGPTHSWRTVGRAQLDLWTPFGDPQERIA
jgi:hypothetical protein